LGLEPGVLDDPGSLGRICPETRTQCADAERKGACVLQPVAKALGLPGRGPAR